MEQRGSPVAPQAAVPGPTTVERCFKCFVEFGWFKRKHTCRNCAKSFCDGCSSNRKALQPGKEQVRICDYCALEQFTHMAVANPPRQQEPQQNVSVALRPGFSPLSSQPQAPMSPQLASYDFNALRRSPSPAGASAAAVPAPSAAGFGPSLNTILSAGSSSVIRELSPLQIASRVPDDVATSFQRVGFDRAALAQLYQTLSQRGVSLDDLNSGLKTFVDQWNSSVPGGSRTQETLSDSLLEEQNQEQCGSRNVAAGGSGSGIADNSSALRVELAEAKAQILEQNQKIAALEKQMQEVEMQVLGGFSFETWKRVQQMSADQAKTVECAVCMDADANMVTSCGCKCMCTNCYRLLPTKPATGFKECPQCFKTIR